jgi:hypothetical protein
MSDTAAQQQQQQQQLFFNALFLSQKAPRVTDCNVVTRSKTAGAAAAGAVKSLFTI